MIRRFFGAGGSFFSGGGSAPLSSAGFSTGFGGMVRTSGSCATRVFGRSDSTGSAGFEARTPPAGMAVAGGGGIGGSLTPAVAGGSGAGPAGATVGGNGLGARPDGATWVTGGSVG